MNFIKALKFSAAFYCLGHLNLVYAFPTEIIDYDCKITVDGEAFSGTTALHLSNNKGVLWTDFIYFNAKDFGFLNNVKKEEETFSPSLESGFVDGFMTEEVRTDVLIENQIQTTQVKTDVTSGHPEGEHAKNGLNLQFGSRLLEARYVQNYDLENGTVKHTIVGECRASYRQLNAMSANQYSNYAEQKLECSDESDVGTCQWVAIKNVR